MSPTPLPILEEWCLDVDASDEMIIRGTVDGVATSGMPPGFYDDRVRLRDGRELQLGVPHPDVATAPHRLPEAAISRRLLRLAADIERMRAGEVPSDAELAAAPELSGWMVQDLTNQPYLAGWVHGHPRLPDGAWITTSPVVWLAPDQRCARTVSRWYRLREQLVRPSFAAH